MAAFRDVPGRPPGESWALCRTHRVFIEQHLGNRVERAVATVRDDCFGGEHIYTIEQARDRAGCWCLTEYGMRRHSSTHRMPREHFETEEKAALLPAPTDRYDPPGTGIPHGRVPSACSGATVSGPPSVRCSTSPERPLRRGRFHSSRKPGRGSERAKRACDRTDGGRDPRSGSRSEAARSDAKDGARSATPEEGRPGARSAEGIAHPLRKTAPKNTRPPIDRSGSGQAGKGRCSLRRIGIAA